MCDPRSFLGPLGGGFSAASGPSGGLLSNSLGSLSPLAGVAGQISGLVNENPTTSEGSIGTNNGPSPSAFGGSLSSTDAARNGQTMAQADSMAPATAPQSFPAIARSPLASVFANKGAGLIPKNNSSVTFG